MKTIIEFNNPEDNDFLDDCQKGYLYKIALHNILDKIRTLEKYKNKENVNLDDIKNNTYEILRDLNIDNEF